MGEVDRQDQTLSGDSWLLPFSVGLREVRWDEVTLLTPYFFGKSGRGWNRSWDSKAHSWHTAGTIPNGEYCVLTHVLHFGF